VDDSSKTRVFVSHILQNVATSEISSGMYRAHGLERHVAAYSVTESDMDLLNSTGLTVNACIAIASCFLSLAASFYLSGQTIPVPNWTSQQYALFDYAPIGCLFIAVVASLIGAIAFKRGYDTKQRIKQESFIPGTYTLQAQ
jgi:hypothetical protein